MIPVLLNLDMLLRVMHDIHYPWWMRQTAWRELCRRMATD